MKNKDDNTKSCFTVYSQRLAGYLMQHGYVLRNLIKFPNQKMNQFLFTDTAELRKEIENYGLTNSGKRGAHR